jgi:hypothetical protein
MSGPRAYATAMRSVYDGSRCLGFILPRGKAGFQAFDYGDFSLGFFPTQQGAADAIVLAAERSS